MGQLTTLQIENLGFRSVGLSPQISDKASFYNCSQITIGDNVRIDDFCVISAGQGGIKIGNHVHIAVYTSLIGAGSISLDDYANISSRVSIYSSNDDYSGNWMTGPQVSKDLTNISSTPVSIEKHVIIGSGSVVLPGVTIALGAAIGAMSLVNKNCERLGIYCGIPIKKIKTRDDRFLTLEKTARLSTSK